MTRKDALAQSIASRWYVVSIPTGIATLCVDEQDAKEGAKEYDSLYPNSAPHVATQLQPA